MGLICPLYSLLYARLRLLIMNMIVIFGWKLMIMVCVYMYGKVLCTKMETGYVAGFFHVKTLIKVGLRFLFYIFYGEGKLGKDSQLIHLEGRTEDLWGRV
jgi:hypothetical protein